MQERFKKILVIEVIALIVLLTICFFKYQENTAVIETPLEDWHTDYLAFENGEYYVGKDGMDIGDKEEIALLHGPYVSLEKGDYTVSIEYECEDNQSFEPCAYKRNIEYIKSARAFLDKNSKLAVHEFKITEDIDNFEVKVFYNGNGEITISNIVIEKNNNDLKRSIVYAVTVLVLLNLVLFFYFASDERKKYVLSILGITFFMSLPIFYFGLNSNGEHDLIFHLLRIEGIVKELRCGNFPARVSTAWMSEYGYPVSIYYGDILLYIPAFLRLFGFTLTVAYKVYLVLINLMTVVFAEYCFRKMFRKSNISMILTLVYATASYRLVNIYIRSAVGEYTALMFLPLIALGIYYIYAEENDTWIKSFKNASLIAVGMTGIITSHILTAEMTVMVMTMICVVYIRKTVTWSAIRTYAIAVVETLLLSAFFLVPFLDYYMNVDVNITNSIGNETAMEIQYRGASISDYFAFFNNPFGDWQTMLFNPGIVLMLILMVAFILWKQKSLSKESKKIVVFSLIMLCLATRYFPWDNLAHDWKMFNLIAQVQFPWRYIGIAIMFMTILMGYVLENPETEIILKMKTKKILDFSAIMSVVMTCIFLSYYADYGARTVFYDAANLDSYHLIGEEYVRTETKIEAFTGEIEAEGVEWIQLESRIGSSMDISCKNGTSETDIILPILNYKGYVIRDHMGNQYEIYDSDNNLVSVTIPSNFEGKLFLRFEEPWYWTAALGISLITVFGMITIVLFCKYNDYEKEKYIN